MKNLLLKLLLVFVISSQGFAEISVKIPAGARYKVGFSSNTESTAQNVVLDAIKSAKKEILMAAFSLNSKVIVENLLKVAKKGVKISIILSERGNLKRDGEPVTKSQIPFLQKNHIPFRMISRKIYPVMQNRFIVIDGISVQTGSFNYSEHLDVKKNAGNALYIMNVPSLAKSYKKEFLYIWKQGEKLSDFSKDEL